MAGESRVAWHEGLFLRPQHFQQQDRQVEALVQARSRSLRPYPWGVSGLQLNASLAAQGKFAVERCEGVLPDGTPFALPDDGPLPEALDIPTGERDAIVYLTLPPRQTAAAEFAAPDDARPTTRYLVREETVRDAFSDQPMSEPIALAELNLRYGVTRDQTEGRIRIGLGRVREVLNGGLVLDERYIPPCLDIRPTRLFDMLTDLLGRTEQQTEVLALRAAEATEGGSDTFASFLTLQCLNRWSPVLTHLQQLPAVHPERLFETLAALYGDLATLATPERRPSPLPRYDHEDLQATFEPLFERLQNALSNEIGRSAELMDLKALGAGSYAAVVDDRNWFSDGAFYLAVSASMSSEDIRRLTPGNVKVGSTLKMREIVRNAVMSVGLSHTPTPPPQIRILPGFVYFELDRNSPEWRDFATAPAIGVHVASDWKGLKLELWWVRRRRR
jgi:type VI secretion system ImpJ/VasE family protein